jgi:TolA-binding protein
MSASLAARLSLVLLLAGTALPASLTSAWAQDAQTIDRINRLERDLQTLQRQVYRGGTPPASSSGGGSLTDAGSDGSSAANRLNARIDELENQIRQMTGRFEEVEFASSQANRRIDKLVEDVDFRLNQLERGGQPQGQQSAPQTGSVEQVKPSAQQQGVPAAGTPVARGSTSSTPGQAPTKEGVLGSMPADAQGRPLTTPNQPQQTARAQAPNLAPASAKGKLPSGSPQERYNYAYKLLVQSDYADAESASANSSVHIRRMRWPAMRNTGSARPIMCAASMSRRRRLSCRVTRATRKARKLRTACSNSACRSRR